VIDIGSITTWLCENMRTAMYEYSFATGDGVAPTDGGWPQGTPNTDENFVPYIVITAEGNAISQSVGVALCSTVPYIAQLPYRMDAYDQTRAGADALASIARDEVKKLGRTSLAPPVGDLVLNPSQIFIDSASGAMRDDSTFPKFWMARTGLRLWVSRNQQ
jgi:hypothetical protein